MGVGLLGALRDGWGGGAATCGARLHADLVESVGQQGADTGPQQVPAL